jgi:putative hydrolase of the HAD superfamily
MLTNGWDHNERAVVLAQFGLDREAFEARHAEPYDAWERDTITIERVPRRNRLLRAAQLHARRLHRSHEGPVRPHPLQRHARPQRPRRHPANISSACSTTSPALHEYRMEKYGLKQHLDVQLSSCYLGMRKPDADIYRRAIDIVGRPPTASSSSTTAPAMPKPPAAPACKPFNFSAKINFAPSSKNWKSFNHFKHRITVRRRSTCNSDSSA